ncbi:glycosyltransferase family 2 [Apiospora kogelbergensis]|uniref:Glycosyltransferase family 2 n=1 Tax=Apiospora kogelbergensis TaxID=1337665 RepID=A0AAW0R2Q3_9PEZI
MLDTQSLIGALRLFLLTPSWFKFHIGLWLWRYTRTIVHTLSHCMYKSKPIPKEPKYTASDVTVVIATIHNAPEELHTSLETILACRPYGMIMITTQDKYNALKELVGSLQHSNIRVLCTDIANMADDDVWWPRDLIIWILAPFEDPKMGGSKDFLHDFQTERWRKYSLNADDDNFVTRWLVNYKWKTWIQHEEGCEIETTLEYGKKYLCQCSRWARSNWRSNWTSLVNERYVITSVHLSSLFY